MADSPQDRNQQDETPNGSMAEQPVHDGRFGKNFDDEISIKSVIWVTLSIAITTALFFILSIWVIDFAVQLNDVESKPPRMALEAASERRLPTGPRLQADPEAELEAMRHELETHLESFGWTDEAGGLAYIPIDKAMDRVVEEGLPAAKPAPAPAPESAAEPAGLTPSTEGTSP